MSKQLGHMVRQRLSTTVVAASGSTLKLTTTGCLDDYDELQHSGALRPKELQTSVNYEETEGSDKASKYGETCKQLIRSCILIPASSSSSAILSSSGSI